ncbi:MAG: methionine--tRNA ligase [Desulfarculus sp.]|nr:methionine--tRNA ligase [Desulfarculus sp.]
MTQSFYITTPIYYVNAEPHLGHAYSTIVCDAAARFHRLLGDEVRFQTGSDEHGDKIAEAAAREGIAPQAYADRVSRMFRDTWPPLNVSHDNFIRTTDPAHIACVRLILQKIYDAGDIYLGKYGGNYCVGCERFLTDKELVEGKCPDHDRPTQYIEEENYFFRMGAYQQALIAHIQEHPDFIRPERYKNEVLSFLKEPLEDLCISRPKTRLTWGIELPFDGRFVTYVWFDALINYLSGLGYPDEPLMAQFWPAAQHLIAKDILKPHGIYWPTMLMSLAQAEGKPRDAYLYQHLNVHGYWKTGQGKMSKSLGNVVAPLDLARVYGADAFRYFLLRDMAFGLDASFSEEALVERYNADLANDLGNLFSRVLNMLFQYRQGVVPAPGEPQADAQELLALAGRVTQAYARQMEGFHFHLALSEIWQLIGEANRFVVKSEPWVLAKDPGQGARLDAVLGALVQVLGMVAVLIQPAMPQTALAMAQHLKLELPELIGLDRLASADLVVPGTALGKPPALFPRIDTAKVKAKAEKAGAKAAQPALKEKKPVAKEAPAPPAQIEYDDFAKVDLRLGTVLAAEKVGGADRLLKLSIDLGEETGPRTVVAGIALHYAPEELVGRQVVVVANLKPVTLKGVESRGMVLAAVGDDKVRVLSPDTLLPPGSKVR